MLLKRFKQKRERVKKALKLLEEKECQEARDAEKKKRLIACREIAKQHTTEIQYISNKVNTIELKEDTDFEDVYTFLAKVNNNFLKLLGDNLPEVWPKLQFMPLDKLEYCSCESTVKTLAENLSVHLKRKPNDINIIECDTDAPELFFLIEIKYLLSRVKSFCRNLL